MLSKEGEIVVFVDGKFFGSYPSEKIAKQVISDLKRFPSPVIKPKKTNTVDDKRRRLEKQGWKFQFVHSSATSHLKTAPVIASKGSRKIRGTSMTDILKKI